MRYAPLTGLLAVVLTVVAFLLGGDTPGTNSSGAKVRSFYEDHQAQQAVSLYLLVIAGVFFVCFAACLARVLRKAANDGDGWLHHVVLAGGVLIAVGFWTGATLDLALVDLADESVAGNDALQALNAIGNDFFIPFVGGFALMLLAAGVAGIRTAAGVLPRWLNWVAVGLGVLAFVPWIGFFAFMVSGLWVIAVSVLLARRPQDAPPVTAPATSV